MKQKLLRVQSMDKVEQAVSALQRFIIEGGLKPGTELPSEDDLEYCVNKDIEFHDILVQSTNNRVFKLMLEPLAELSRESRLETMRISGIDKPIVEHRAIIEAIKARDPERAVECMQNHLQTAESNLRDLEANLNL